MRKLSVIAITAVSSLFLNCASAATLSGSSVDVDASVDVASPSSLSATWTKGPLLQAGSHPGGTRIGSMSVSNLGNNYGWVIYSDGTYSQMSGGGAYTSYKFINSDGSALYARVHSGAYPGVSYGAGTGIGTGPATFIPANHTSVDFELINTQNLNAGTYSAMLSVSAYNN
ncbi:CD15/CS22/SEF14 family fimbrial major subunit [Escherichia coli]|uniref:CD15/CS22/SEF14 family fimbrial major subunit n=1 Tax=Escherichia coli TaxID=562 RepID=UPI0015E1BED1|nr:CD15/CS22/SEF14 family fimbrial major subunit [Escherichia coli]